MCFHSKQSKKAQELANRFNATVDEAYEPKDYLNGFSHPLLPVVTHKERSRIQLFKWGLIPSWAKDSSIAAKTLNAKSETVTTLPSFKASANNRCWVLVDGFFEWTWLDSAGKKKQKYLITIPSSEAFALGGIWSQWKDPATGLIVPTFSILTQEANPFMSVIHNTKKRMPFILTPGTEEEWLQGGEVDTYNIELTAHPM